MKPILERQDVTPSVFNDEILPAAQPVVMRQIAAHWPMVQAGKISALAAVDYLRKLDRGHPVSTMSAPASARGRFFYNRDLTGFNFQRGTAKLASSLDFILEYGGTENPPALAIQAVQVRSNFPEFEQQNPLALKPGVEPRLWIGTAGIVAAHHDPSENIAVATAGRRRFTLFPPDQVSNLYIGPRELTPAGAPISMVNFEEPDFTAFPRFKDALAAAQQTELEPGDAIYIPYHWWHHVRALEPFNILVNYWWASPAAGRPSPDEALMLALLSMSAMPESQRQAWRTLFDHYIFERTDDIGAHLPPDKRGILLSDLDDETVKKVRKALARALS